MYLNKSYIGWIVLGLVVIAITIYFVVTNIFITEKSLIIESNHPKTIIFGWIGPLSGKTVMLGIDGLKAIQLAIDEYNQSKKIDEPTIQLVTEDSPLGKETGKVAYLDMMNNKHTAIIFVVSSDDTKAIANIAQKDPIILINPLNNDRTLANLMPNLFLIAKTTESMTDVFVNRMLKQNQRRILVVYSTSESFTVNFAKTFAGAYSAAGGDVIMAPYDALTIKDFKTILAQGVKQKVDSYLFIGDTEMGIAINQAREMGIKEDLYASNLITNSVSLANAKDAINGVYFSAFTFLDGNPILANTFINKFINKYHSEPHVEWSALQAYDAAQIAIYALKMAYPMPGKLSDNIRKILFNLVDYEGTSGNISINPDGTSAGINPGLYQFKNGTQVRLK